MERNSEQYTSITYLNDRRRNSGGIYIGKRLYLVSSTRADGYSHIFTEPCPSCNNTRTIKYIGYDKKEYETECPFCRNKATTSYENKLELYRYSLDEYIINELTISGTELKSDYVGEKIPELRIWKVGAFCKFGRGCSDVERHTVELYKIVDITLEEWKCMEEGKWNEQLIDKTVTDYLKNYRFFTDKRVAEAVIKRAIEIDKKRLAEFNAKFGTNHVYPW